MPTFHASFGVQYAQEQHPTIPRAHPRTFLEVVAPDYSIAHALAMTVTGGAFAFLHEEGQEGECAHHPNGLAARLVYEVK